MSGAGHKHYLLLLKHACVSICSLLMVFLPEISGELPKDKQINYSTKQNVDLKV